MSVETAIPPAGHPQPADSLKQMNGTADRPNGVSNGHAGSGGENGERQKSSHKSSSKDKHRDKDRDHHRSDKDKNREKDKSRDKDREREKDKSRDKDRDKHKSSSSGTGGGHSSSSKSGSGSSSKDKERSDKDKQSSSGSSGNKDKEKTHHSSSSSHKSSKSDKDKDRSKDKDRDKDSKHRSREDGKDRSDRDKKDRDRDRDKSKSSSDKDKHKSSSSSSGNKDKDREKHKTSSSSSGREKDKEKHSSSSSSKRDKDKSSSSSSSKHKDRRDGKEQRDNAASSVPGEVKTKEETDAAPPGFLNGEGHLVAPGGDDANANNNRAGKERDPLDISQASSCDYSMSQFRADETPFPLKNETMDHNQSNQDGEYQDEDDDESGDNEGSGNENGHFNHQQQQQQQQAQHYQNQGGYFGGMQQQHEQYQASMNQIQHEPLDIKAEPYETQVKQEEDSEDEIPLSKRKKKDSDEAYEDGSSKKKKIKTEKKDKKKNKKRSYESGEDNDDDGDYGSKKTKKSKVKKEPVQETPKPTKGALKTEVKTESTPTKGGRQKKKAEEEEQEVWKWWEEEKREDGVKWNFLEHKGPVFAPAYEPLPPNVTFEYAGKTMRLSEGAEEVAGFYARMLDHDYTSKKAFNENFFKDWRKTMTQSEREIIKDLGQCNFRSMAAHFAMVAEQNRNRTKEQKLALKAENEKLLKEYGICVIDGHKEKIGNFKIEPPGLFRGRGEHPKMGLVKRRVMPEDVIINCSRDSKVPVPPAGHRWKEVRHDNTVSWLASWVENVQGQVKYIMLNPSSKLKGEKDWQKYETARCLLKHIDQIRDTYREEWKSKEMRIRQRAVAMYFIDKLALRAGNEKDEDQADTVGCCSLRVEHIQLCKELNGKENVVVFDFLGKDSIRYYNEVAVEKRVFKNLELFKENKKTGDDLFDRLNTSVLNEYLKNLMEGLTAKVFRTFNASFTLQKQLEELTDPNMTVPEKLLAYNRANRAVAILCNHQRAVPKTHEKSMGNLKEKIRLKREQVEQCQQELKDLKKSNIRDATAKEKKTKQLERLMEQLKKLELMETDKDENKTIALGTSKLNYLDPRISVAWCKKFGVPIEKIFNKTQRDKFRWAIDMADENYVF